MLIAHIGRGKCASSTLQNALYTQRLQLLDRGIYVPETAHAGNHHELFEELTGDADPALALTEVAESLRNPAYTSTVISSEFFLDMDENSVQKLVHAVPGGAIRAIIYLRDYAGWFPSLYAQKTKKGRLRHDFDWYFENEFEKKVSIIPQIQVWASCIGAENLRVRQMQDGLIDGNSITQDMGLQIGTHLAPIEQRNVTPHWWAVEFRRAIARLAPSRDAATERAVGFAMQQFNARAREEGVGPARYLTEEQSGRLRDLYHLDIQVLRRLLGHPTTERFSRPVPTREGSEPPSVAMVPTNHIAEVAAMCAQRFGPESALIHAMHMILDEAH